MSSSFTNQPSPHHDPQDEPGYTPTKPAPRRAAEETDDVEALPKLGSLAQKARGKQLKAARAILFFVGGLTILVNSVDLAMSRSVIHEQVQKQLPQQGRGVPGGVNQAQVQQQEDLVFLIACAIDGVYIFMGVLFIIFAVIIYRFPVPVTIISLVLFVLTWVVGILIALAIDPVLAASVAGSGIVLRIIFIVVLAKAIQSAFAYEKERRAEQEYGRA